MNSIVSFPFPIGDDNRPHLLPWTTSATYRISINRKQTINTPPVVNFTERGQICLPFPFLRNYRLKEEENPLVTSDSFINHANVMPLSLSSRRPLFPHQLKLNLVVSGLVSD